MPPCTNCNKTTLPFVAALTGGLCFFCFKKWRHHSTATPVIGNMDEWSDASKRSRSYEKGAQVAYFDEYYWCDSCKKPCVFSATDQKHVYEVKKRYFLQRRKLCDACWEAAPH